MLIGALERRPRGDPVGRASGFSCYMGGGVATPHMLALASTLWRF